MKFFVPNYSCLQNTWLRGYRPQIPVLSVLYLQLNLLNPPTPPEQNFWVRHWCDGVEPSFATMIPCYSVHKTILELGVSRIVRLQLENTPTADPSGHAVQWLGLWLLACQDCGFESCRKHGYLPLGIVVCCQVEFPASGWSLVQRSPNECGESERDRGVWILRRPRATRDCCAMEKFYSYTYWYFEWK